MSLRCAPNPHRKNYRVAVVTSKKVNKSAVIRNRIRRRVYEAVRLQEQAIKDGYDLVFSVYSDEVATMDKNELDGLVQALLKRAKALN